MMCENFDVIWLVVSAVFMIVLMSWSVIDNILAWRVFNLTKKLDE